MSIPHEEFHIMFEKGQRFEMNWRTPHHDSFGDAALIWRCKFWVFV